MSDAGKAADGEALSRGNLREALREELGEVSKDLRELVRKELQEVWRSFQDTTRTPRNSWTDNMAKGDVHRATARGATSSQGLKSHRLTDAIKAIQDEEDYGVLDPHASWRKTPKSITPSLSVAATLAVAVEDDDEEAEKRRFRNEGTMHEAPLVPGTVPERPDDMCVCTCGTVTKGSNFCNTCGTPCPNQVSAMPSVGRLTSNSQASLTSPSIMSQRQSGDPVVSRTSSKRQRKNPNAADKAMAMVSQQGSLLTDEDVESGGLRRAVERLIRNVKFELLVSSMIVISAIHIGAQTNYMAQHETQEVPLGFRIIEIFFLSFFLIEWSLRVFVYRGTFFNMWGWGWNVFDTFLVFSQCTEELVLLVAGDVDLPDTSSFLLRIIRIMRSIRTIRVLHVTRFAEELRLLVTCVLYSVKAFCWSLALIVLILYIVAILLTQLVLTYRVDRQGQELPSAGVKMSGWYGTVPRAILSLFQGLTGGVDWNDLVQPMMEEISPWLGVFFFLYTSFVILAVMNVVTATFVENAIERASQVKEGVKMNHANRLFKALDGDNSGFITLNEILESINKPEVKEFFRSIDVDASEAQMLFELLDNDGSGSIDFEEFLGGCMRLQGPARSVDLVLFVHELKRNQRGMG